MLEKNSMTHSDLGDIQSSTLLVEDENAVGDLLSPGEDAPHEKELRRQLIEQLYERSVERYGADSEQARMLLGLLGSAKVEVSNVGRVEGAR